ncbi:MAG TPA: NAD(P) transhydrogenase subunit alpha [Phycisphaerae bacterium]|nr:NAD(P) transhydrogenase subunit alpha [Phycisphaerae bacterium]HNU47096.1 NAD(P) transhydrogenase subunit alpha [Phycisphaerae bacterium]
MTDVFLMLVVFGAVFALGYLLIRRVPQMLHTPLMSMTNAISAVTILGALLLFAVETTPVEKVLGALAIVTAIFNVAGGFVITDRMLAMFRRKDTPRVEFRQPQGLERAAARSGKDGT